jgi:aminoglycoside 3-N-acetyltransferase
MQSESINKIVVELANSWRLANINEGDILILHSSIWRLLMMAQRRNKNFCVDDIINSYLEAIGPTGTLLLPTFTFSVLRNLVFDIRNTPSETGILSETLRQRKESIRTNHPFLSFAVIGKESRRFAKLEDYTGVGPNSPFALAQQLGGKIGILDLEDNDCMSIYHHVEFMLKVNYRILIERNIEYINWEGKRSNRIVGHYGRDIKNGIIANVTAASNEIWNLGLYNGESPFRGHGFRSIDIKKFFLATAKIISEGRALGMLYESNH